MSNELKRYDITDKYSGSTYGIDADEASDGDWVKHSDALAAIEAAKPKWLPIEQADKHGDPIDVLCNGQRFNDIRWSRISRESRFGWCYEDLEGETFFLYGEPSHFMKPPPPPESD